MSLTISKIKIYYPVTQYQQHLQHYFTFFLQNLFGILKLVVIPLQQFFSYRLSRKAEGNGPLTP